MLGRDLMPHYSRLKQVTIVFITVHGHLSSSLIFHAILIDICRYHVRQDKLT